MWRSVMAEGGLVCPEEVPEEGASRVDEVSEDE